MNPDVILYRDSINSVRHYIVRSSDFYNVTDSNVNFPKEFSAFYAAKSLCHGEISTRMAPDRIRHRIHNLVPISDGLMNQYPK